MIDAERVDALAATWTVLARLLAQPPDEDVLTRLRSPDLLADWPGGADADASEGVQSLLKSAAEGETAEAIGADYRRLIVGPGPALVNPYESVHLSIERLLFEEQTLSVRAAYARMGLAAPRLNREPDDHIALELEFLGTLAAWALDALEDGRVSDAEAAMDAHDRFLAEHLLLWGPAFFEGLRDKATTSFYRGVGGLGVGALRRVQVEA